MSFQNFNLRGFEVLTGKRAFITNPDESVRTTPTPGKIVLSDGFAKESGLVANGHIVFMSLPNQLDYGVSRTFQDRVEDVYALAPGFGVKSNGRNDTPSFGNYLSDTAGSGVSFASSAAWNALYGSSDGSNYFKCHPVYGIAAIAENEFVAVTAANVSTLPANTPCVIWVANQDGCILDLENPITVGEAAKMKPVWALEFVKFEEKSVRGENDADGEGDAKPKTKGRPAAKAKAEKDEEALNLTASELAEALGTDFSFGDEDGSSEL
jgi:hypothetical protein